MTVGRRTLIGLLASLAAGLAALAWPAAVDTRAQAPAPPPAAVAKQSFYLTMRDGVKLAATVYRLADASGSTPAILLLTPYHRETLPRNRDAAADITAGGPSRNIGSLVRAGYAYVSVDVRGTGASFGVYRHMFARDEVRDGVEVVDWIVKQPWSNGIVGVEGVSYSGTAAELLLAEGHPAVKAIMPQFTLYDAYSDIIRPGGLFSERFARTWALYTQALDRNTPEVALGPGYLERAAGVAPVDGSEALLTDAVKAHAANVDPYALMSGIHFKDDRVGDFTTAGMSPYPRREAVLRSGVPIYSITGWLDGGYAYGAIRRFLNTPTPGSKMVIGPWDHGGRQNISPCGDRRKELFESRDEARRFFDFSLKGVRNGFDAQAPVRYYTMCAEAWRTSTTWPPAHADRTLFMASQGQLQATAPSAPAADAFKVDYHATSGTASRWVSYVNTAAVRIGYGDRASQAGKVLGYTSPVLEEALEVTGHPLVALWLASDQPQGQVFVYLEDVDPSGTIAYVTEGEVDLSSRRLSDGAAPYRQPTPYRSFARTDARPMVPGRVEEVRLDLLPTSYLFRRGHRVRISIAGADADNFQVPAGPEPTFTIYQDPRHPSRLVLPVVTAPRSEAEP